MNDSNQNPIKHTQNTDEHPVQTPVPGNNSEPLNPTETQQAPTQPIGEAETAPEAQTSENSEEKSSKKESIKGVVSTLAIFLMAPILAIVLTTFVFQSYEVDGPSMETTLQNQDRLIVYKFPKTWADAHGKEFIPTRGEIIVFSKEPATEFSAPETKQLIKRVIGVPGDHVVIENGTVTVYNEEHPTGFNPDEETKHLDPGEATSGNVDTTVEEGELFVLGDNRGNSLDSRSFGPIKTESVTGTLALRIYPFHKFQGY